MKKKLFSPKTLMVGGLCLLCVATLVGVLYLTSTPKSTFTPEGDTSVGTNDKWEDNSESLPTDVNTQKPADGQTDTDAENQMDDKYQVVSESEDETVINMTPPAEKPKAPEASGAAGVPNDKKPNPDNSVPAAPPAGGDCVPSAPEKKPEPSQPGKVYDPVFGWIELSPGVGETVDSDGDPDKMVGSMGD